MSASFRALVLAALTTGDAFQNALTELKERARTMSYTNFNNQCAEIIGEKLGVAPHVSRKGEGVLTFEKDSAAEQRLARLRKLHPDFGGKKSNKAEEVEIPEELLKAAQRLAALANQYEGARSLASKALALAFAK